MTRRSAEFRRPATIIASLILAACTPHATSGLTGAAGGSTELIALPLSNWRPPSGQRCVAAALPATLPSVAQLVDDGMVGAVLSDQPLPENGYALLSLKFDTTGGVTRVVVIEGTIGAADRRRVALAVANAVYPQPAAAAPWGVRLRLDATTPPLLRVGRAEWCDAVPAGTTSITKSVQLERSGPGEPPSAQMVLEPAKWRVIVSADGRVVSSELLTPTHHPDLAHDAQEALAGRRYHPALDDRVPVAVMDTVDFPIVGIARR